MTKPKQTKTKTKIQQTQTDCTNRKTGPGLSLGAAPFRGETEAVATRVCNDTHKEGGGNPKETSKQRKVFQEWKIKLLRGLRDKD